MAMTLLGNAVRWRFEKLARYTRYLTHLWWDDLRNLIPGRYRKTLIQAFGSPESIFLELDEAVALRTDGRSTPTSILRLTEGSADNRIVTLKIRAASVLQRRLELPGAAVTRLDVTLETNLEHWTPFAREEIYAAVSPLPEIDHRPGMKIVELRCVSRTYIDNAIETMREMGFEPDTIELGDARFTLTRRTRKRLMMRRRRLAVASLAAALAIQGLCGWVILASRQLDELEELESARSSAVAALRRHASAEKAAAARRESAKRIATKMEGNLSVSQGLRLLGEVLPTNVIVREFEVGRDRADGRVVLIASADLDVVKTLGRTGFFRVGELGVLPSSEAEKKIFSVGFTVPPWIQAERSVAR